MLIRAIAPDWALTEFPGMKKVVEGDFDESAIMDLNEKYYNIYFFPNSPSAIPEDRYIDGPDIDQFSWVFVDFDLKSGTWPSKSAFIEAVKHFPLPPTRIVDSGNGIHLYWSITDLDAMTYLKLQRRLCRFFKTDDAVGKLMQLMRLPGYCNTKKGDAISVCEEVSYTGKQYTCEELGKWLHPLSHNDSEYCQRHYNQVHKIGTPVSIDEKMPAKFAALLKNSNEVKELFAGDVDDRSKADYRLAHIMFAEGFTKDEATSVLVNCGKALERSTPHRISYAQNIVEKIFIFEETQNTGALSSSVRDILRRSGDTIKGTRFPCWSAYDGTEKGFRLTQVLGLVGGAGSGKTTLALNYFYWFTKFNPDYVHMFVSLEQPVEELAQRWAKIAAKHENLHDRVHVLGNYNEDGSYRNLSLSEIEAYVVKFQEENNVKVGCVVIDHIGVLKKKGKEGENQGLMDICHNMKAFAKRTNTFLVMQSQTSREKAGNGDLELDKDAAYGTSLFEWYLDYQVTTWQPLKRVYDVAPHMTCSAFKYCKIRNKNVLKDKTKEDVVHVLMYNPETELLEQMNQTQESAYEFFDQQATTLRNKDRKRDTTRITKIDWVEGEEDEATRNTA